MGWANSEGSSLECLPGPSRMDCGFGDGSVCLLFVCIFISILGIICIFFVGDCTLPLEVMMIWLIQF